MNLKSDAISWPVKRLRKTIENLLFYLEVPDAETTARPEWLAKISEDISDDFFAVYSVLTDQAEQQRISKLRVEATHFANVLNANPGIRLSHWTESFPDCLSLLRAFQRELKATEAGPQENKTPPKAYSPWKKTSDIQKHLEIGSTTWQRHRKELGDEILNHPTSGAQKVKFTRFAAETLHIITSGIEFKASDDTPESYQ